VDKSGGINGTRVISDEKEQLEMGIDYSEHHVRLATVHTRQDLVLVVSYLSQIEKQMKAVRSSTANANFWLMAIFILGIAVPFARSRGWINW
jgi:hypothetical protein